MQSRKQIPLIIMVLVVVLLALSCLLLLKDSEPKDERGTLSGNVVDASDNSSLKGVNVTVINQEGVRYDGYKTSDTTDSDGFFSLELPPDKYTLKFEADGYQPLKSSASYTVKKDKETKIAEAFRVVAVAPASDAAAEQSASDAGKDAASNSDADNAAQAAETPRASAPEQEAVKVRYTVYCEDEYGNILSSTTNEGTAGSEILLYAPQISGYIPETSQKEVTILSDEEYNDVYFYYESESDPAESSYSIPPEAFVFGGHSYYADRVSCESIYTYWMAESYAEKLGGHLAVITSSAENEALYNYVFNTLGYESAYFGLTDDGTEGSWYWVNGVENGYRSWAAGQPDNHNGNENYALFYYKDDPYTWNDGDFGPDDYGTVTFLIEWDTE